MRAINVTQHDQSNVPFQGGGVVVSPTTVSARVEGLNVRRINRPILRCRIEYELAVSLRPGIGAVVLVPGTIIMENVKNLPISLFLNLIYDFISQQFARAIKNRIKEVRSYFRDVRHFLFIHLRLRIFILIIRIFAPKVMSTSQN